MLNTTLFTQRVKFDYPEFHYTSDVLLATMPSLSGSLRVEDEDELLVKIRANDMERVRNMMTRDPSLVSIICT